MPVARGFKKGKRKRSAYGLIVTGLIMLILFVFLDGKIRDIVKTVSQNRANAFAVSTINEAVSNQLKGYDFTYDSLVTIERQEDGTVSSIETNVKNVNLIHAAITESITQDLSNMEQASIFLPIGNFTNTTLLAGRGPKIEMQFIPSGYVIAQTVSEFSSAGINQTLHRIVLNITVNIVSIIPGFSATTQTTTEYVLAETVIVGEIPQYFTQVVGESQSEIESANNFSNSQKSVS